MRQVGDVIKQIMAVVPDGDCLQLDLKKAYDSSCYQPPESRLCWLKLADAFQDRFGDYEPTDGWQKQAVDILMDKEGG